MPKDVERHRDQSSRRFAAHRRFVAAVAVLLVSSAVAHGDAMAAPNDPDVVAVLVMGDSYSAGNGAGSYRGAKGCRRSTKNYAQRYARLLQQRPYDRRTRVATVACSGDKISAVGSPHGGRRAQQEAVDERYDVIFLTIGGNDLNFDDIVKFCLVAKFRDGANCGPLLGHAEALLSDGTIERRLAEALKAIRSRAHPQARIVLLGYPYLEGDREYRLRSGHGGRTFIAVGARLREIQDAGEAVQERVVHALNFAEGTNSYVYVDPKAVFLGGLGPDHSLFAKRNNRDRWFIQPFVDAGLLQTAIWYHPNPAGWRAEARLLFEDPRVPKDDVLSASGKPLITEFPLLDVLPEQITSGPDGNLWFSGSGRELKIRRMTPAGVVTDFVLPSSDCDNTHGVTAGPDGNIWFTELNCAGVSKVGRITPSGDIAEYPLPRQAGIAAGIAPGPDGNLWFTEVNAEEGNRIGRVTPDGRFTEFRIPTEDAQAWLIAAGPDGNMWFAEENGNKIGRITLAGDITEFPLPRRRVRPRGIVGGLDGNIWFTESGAGRIGRISPSGHVEEFPIPVSDGRPMAIAMGPDGNLWFTCPSDGVDYIGRITMTGEITMYPVPSGEVIADGITTGPDGNIWFAESAQGRIGRLAVVP